MSDIKISRDEGGLVRSATQSHIEVKPMYNPDDLANNVYERDIANPGQFPYTRGLYPKMFRERLWLKSFIVSYATEEETNEAFKSYIKNGLNDLRLLADLPTQSGIDPDHPMAWNSMMCGGVAHYAMISFEKMLDSLPLEGVTYETAHSNISSAIFCHSCLVGMMEKRGLEPRKLRGNGICDPIRAKLVYASPDWSTEINRQICLDHVTYTVDNTPKWKAVAPNGVDPCQAGMSAVQELGEVMAVCTVIMDDFVKRGYKMDDYGSMVVALDAESDFFETIAKFRAARRMWAKITKERFGAKDSKAMQLKIGIRTSGLALQWQKPLNNASRVTLQILSSVLGGVNSIDASSIDEAIGLPSYEARMFNLDAQHIITHEANIPLVADPLGGSYYLEWMTDKIEADTNAYLKEIEERGGIYECLDSGWLNGVMEQNRLKIQREKAEGKRLLIGVNSFMGEEGPMNKAVSDCAYKVPTEQMRADKVEEVKKYKASRDKAALGVTVKALYEVARKKGNISRAVIDGVKAGMTMGEMTGIVRLAYDLCYDPMEMLPTPDYIKTMIEG